MPANNSLQVSIAPASTLASVLAAYPPRRSAHKKMNPVIREYQPGDFDACRALWAELMQRPRDIYDDPSIGGVDPGHGIDPYLSNPKRRGSWVAEVGGRIVAFAGLLVHGEEGEIEPIIVSSLYRSKGIGTMLVDQVLKDAKAMGVSYLSVRPVARTKEAIALFVRLGFDQLGHIQLFQDLSESPGTKREPVISIRGHELGY